MPSASADAAYKETHNSTTAINKKHKWQCDMCSHRTATQQQMQTHCNSAHNQKHQYICKHCTFSASQLSQILAHIDERHNGKVREALHVYHKIPNQHEDDNPRPLWQRDDPTRVRHIRGILMEDIEESEQYRKRLCLDEDYEDEEAVNDEAVS